MSRQTPDQVLDRCIGTLLGVLLDKRTPEVAGQFIHEAQDNIQKAIEVIQEARS